jgi:hypothetical protein
LREVPGTPAYLAQIRKRNNSMAFKASNRWRNASRCCSREISTVEKLAHSVEKEEKM